MKLRTLVKADLGTLTSAYVGAISKIDTPSWIKGITSEMTFDLAKEETHPEETGSFA